MLLRRFGVSRGAGFGWAIGNRDVRGPGKVLVMEVLSTAIIWYFVDDNYTRLRLKFLGTGAFSMLRQAVRLLSAPPFYPHMYPQPQEKLDGYA
jgi:hypothetical protein